MSKQDRSAITEKIAAGTETWRIPTFLVVLLWGGFLLYRARDWASTDRLFPYIVGSVLVLLIVLQLLKSSGLLSRFEPELSAPADPIEESSLVSDDDAERSVEDSGMNLLAMVAWIVVFPILAYYIGYLLATPVYLFSFLWYVLGDVKRSVAYTAVIMVVLYLVFFFAFDINFWRGELFRG